MKIRNITFTMAIIAIAAFAFIKANKKERMSDIALANIEALANNESEYDYVCYGTGKVVCPYSGELVEGYYIRRSLR